jgi:hypothetical protein
MFRVGDLVRLSEEGKRVYHHRSDNPHDEVGIVFSVNHNFSDTFFRYKVRWSSGTVMFIVR